MTYCQVIVLKRFPSVCIHKYSNVYIYILLYISIWAKNCKRIQLTQHFLTERVGFVFVWGIDRHIQEWLQEQGVACRSMDESTGKIILVGQPNQDDLEGNWLKLEQSMRGGSIVLFLDFRLWKNNPTFLSRLPLENTGICNPLLDWLYRKENIANRHPVFEGL